MQMNGDPEHEERARRLIKVGLHFCKHYNNVVKYNPELCEKCPSNGLKPPPGDSA